MARPGLIRRLMTPQDAPAAAEVAPDIASDAAIEVSAPLPESADAVVSEVAQATPRARVSLLASLGPIFRAALVYPGVDAPAGAWAGAIRRMSEVSAQLTDQVAKLQRDEIDIAWARRELHPAIILIVSEFWVAGVVRAKAIRSIEDVPLRAEEILPGLVAAERAVHGYARVREPVSLPVEAELLPALAMVTTNAQACANLLRAHAGVEVSLDAYVAAVADALLAAVAQGADRAQMPGLDRQAFMVALLGASTGIVTKACELAINETLQQLRDLLKEGAAAPTMAEAKLPAERTAQLIKDGIGRLAGTYAYIAQGMGGAGG